MSCKICEKDAPLNERGLCETCAAKLANLSAASSTFRQQMSERLPDAPEAVREPNSVSTPADSAESAHTVLEFGQSEACALVYPFSVALTETGDIVVLDRPAKDAYRMSLFDNDGQYVRTIRQCARGNGPDQLKLPKGITVDRRGAIYIPDAGNSRIQRFDAQGGLIGSLGTQGDGPAEFDYPCNVEVDDMGMLYVADTYNCRIQKITPQGALLLVIGANPDDAEEDESDELEPLLDEPLGVTVDSQRNVYVADTGHHRVVKFDPEGRFLMAFGEKGTERGQLLEPSDVRVDEEVIYVADMNNSRVQRFDGAGNVLGEFRLAEGAVAEEQGGDIAIDLQGLLVICRTNTHTVAKVELIDILPPSEGGPI